MESISGRSANRKREIRLIGSLRQTYSLRSASKVYCSCRHCSDFLVWQAPVPPLLLHPRCRTLNEDLSHFKHFVSYGQSLTPTQKKLELGKKLDAFMPAPKPATEKDKMSNPAVINNDAILESLLQQLTLQRQAYLETSSRIETLLTQHFNTQRGRTLSSGSNTLPAPSPNLRPRTPPSANRSFTDPLSADREFRLRQSSFGPSTFRSETESRWTEFTDDENDDLYVSAILEPQEYDHEEFRDHLREYDWDAAGRTILKTIVDDPARMRWPLLFPNDEKVTHDRSHYTHCQIFDVGNDGAPIPTYDSRNEHTQKRAVAVWNTIKSVNAPSKQTKSVGRITILREPSPILFAAAHFTTHQIFDTDELFHCLIDDNASSAHLHRAFDTDPRRQSSFMFSFEYFTIIGEDCKPMDWQISDKQVERKPRHIPLTRCSSVVALSLSSMPIRKIRNPSRRATTAYGYVYDPWAPWQILNLQAFADWKSTTDTHDSTKHFVNGVEAFVATVLAEYTDAEVRLEHIYREISTLITPPLGFMFDSELRDQLLFEDSEFTYSRRYFWAYQTCGIMIDCLKSLIDSYEDSFTDDVWEGKHKSLWPIIDPESARNKYFKKRMGLLRAKFHIEITKLKKLMEEFHDRRRDIVGLRDQLFSGTSVLESRKSVDMAETTVQQGHNIKLLTLVSIFFLPLTFVTSVFGMTQIRDDQNFTHFAIALVTICVPFFVLVGSLNSSRVLQFWLNRIKNLTIAAGRFVKKLKHRKKNLKRKLKDSEDGSQNNEEAEKSRSERDAIEKVRRMNTAEIVEYDRKMEERWKYRGSVAGRGARPSDSQNERR